MQEDGQSGDQLSILATRGAEVLRAGGLVAVPTDTQYALSALASQGGAVMRCYDMKRRSDDDPMPIFLPDDGWLDTVATDVPAIARALAEDEWPGPLTLVLQRNPDWSSLAVPGKTIAVRIPRHPVALALLAAVGQPITGSSANRHGDPAPVDERAVHATFGDDVSIFPILGVVPGGTASTILDCTSPEPRVLRPGALDETQVAELLARHLAASNN